MVKSLLPDQEPSARPTRLPGDLRAHEYRLFSQNGEDGIIQEVIRRIGEQTRFFVEFGTGAGSECNCARLARECGWHGLFLEANQSYFEQLERAYACFPGIRTMHSLVTSSNIESLLDVNGVPREFDLLSIDIDGNDYWVWAAVQRWKPRVVVIEYNASYRPPQKWVMRENPHHVWDGTNYFGASLASLMELGRRKGYALVGTNSSGVNAFFVRSDLIEGGAFVDADLHYHYSPPSYGPHQGGHPQGNGVFLEI
jgi:hypothetical protein